MRYWKLSAYQIALIGIDTREKELMHGELETAYLSEDNMVVCKFVGLTTRRAVVIRTGVVAPSGVSDDLDEVLHGTRKTAC